MAAGSASIDVGRPIPMPMEELLESWRLAPGRAVANHLEALTTVRRPAHSGVGIATMIAAELSRTTERSREPASMLPPMTVGEHPHRGR